ncbi:MAG: LysM peptidoglycan-binding domain-containing protein [Actinomycetota bacterium]|nr:MAG: LysM peptidoglycan-binding domain-containing protein [Actinomycetota bacterium]
MSTTVRSARTAVPQASAGSSWRQLPARQPATFTRPATSNRPGASNPPATPSRQRISPQRISRQGTSRRKGPARLTRRGRLVLLVLLVLLMFAAVSFGRSASSEASSEAARPATRELIVQPGQSLWQIAQHVAPGVDPREMVLRIRDLNDLDSSLVVPGQPLVVPVFV